jgi:hypothetical protein
MGGVAPTKSSNARYRDWGSHQSRDPSVSFVVQLFVRGDYFVRDETPLKASIFVISRGAFESHSTPPGVMR